MYEASIIVRDSCYCVDQTLDMTQTDIQEALSTFGKDMSLELWLALNSILSVKFGVIINNSNALLNAIVKHTETKLQYGN